MLRGSGHPFTVKWIDPAEHDHNGIQAAWSVILHTPGQRVDASRVLASKSLSGAEAIPPLPEHTTFYTLQ